MTISATPIFIPGLILTRDIFAAQIDGLVHPAAAKTADTLGRDSFTLSLIHISEPTRP